MEKDLNKRAIVSRASIETAVVALRHLIDTEPKEESKFQSFLESHPVVLRVLGFQEFWPHPILKSDSEDDLIPDFIGRTVHGFYEIIELKTPSVKLVSGNGRRTRLSQELSKHQTQCDDYIKWFARAENRAWFSNNYEIDISNEIATLLIAGRNIDRDRARAALIENPRKSRILTYDDVLSALEFNRKDLFGKYENAEGIMIMMSLTVFRSEETQTLVTTGSYERGIYVSVEIDKSMRVRARITFGSSSISVLSKSPIAEEQPISLLISASVIDGKAFLHVYHGVEEQEEIDVYTDFEGNVFSDICVVGGDFDGAKPSAFVLHEIVITKSICDFESRLGMNSYFFDKVINGNQTNGAAFWREAYMVYRANYHGAIQDFDEHKPRLVVDREKSKKIALARSFEELQDVS